MTGTSKGLNCTPPLGSITVDSDIVGSGALAAFFVTAVITITAVIFGYLSGSLGDEYNSDLDRDVINWAETKAQSFRSSAPTPTAGSKEKFRQARKQAVTQFILALSDQQLVTGLAILISGVSNQKKLSGYEFSVVLCLAWFSSTTHLATLDALRTYLRSHSAIRDIRVCAMVLVLVLLLYVFCVTIISLQLDATIPVQCIFSHRPEPGGDAIYMIGVASSAITLLILVYGYCVRIWSLYFDDGTLCGMFARVSSWLPSRDNQSPLLMELQLSDEQHIQVLHAASRAASLRYLLWLPPWMRQAVKGSYLVQASFLSTLTGIAYSFAYGVSQVILYRWLGAPSLDAETDYMGFGQIMAIFLLVLPFLSAAECYHDYIEKVSKTTETDNANEQNTPSQQGVDSSNTTEQAVVNTSNDSDIQTLRTTYTRLRNDIVNYLAPDVFLIQHFEAQQTTFNDTEQKLLDGAKASVLKEYLRFKDCEKEVTTTSAIGFFIVTVFIWSLVGVLLNISTSSDGAFGQGLIAVLAFTSLLTGEMMNLVTRVYALRHILFINSVASQELQEQINRGRGTAVQLTQVRRGATGLVEEGQR